jgi:hypothetical protein
VNCVQRAEFGRHRQRRTIEDDGIDFDELQRRDELQDLGAAVRDVVVGQLRAEPKAIQRAKALSEDEDARDASCNPAPLR